MQRRKWLIFLFASLLLIGMFLSGCQSGKNGKRETVWRQSGGWPKPPLFQGNNFANGGVGAAYPFVFEGLFQNVRFTDKQYFRLAESLEHQGNKTIVKIKSGVKWNDGEPFTSKDVWAYYTLNNGAEVTKYLESIEAVDDLTIAFNWRDPSPAEHMKQLFIGQDGHGTIPYHLYHKYVDKAAELLKKAKPFTEPNKEGPFGLEIKDEVREAMDENWRDFLKAGPDFPVGTGPFIVKKVTASDMLLEKNPNYWNVENIHFDKITIKNPGPDPSAGFALVRSGNVDWFDGTPPRDIIESILKLNKDIAHYKMLDPASVGMVFNLDRPPFDNKDFRKAIVYALDRKKIREIGNYYGQESDVSMAGMPQSEFDNWITPEIRDQMEKFTHNPEKAAEILTNLGWTKGSNGIWRDPEGKVHEFIIGVNGGWQNGPIPGQVAAEQLTEFGLPTKLIAVDGTVYFDNAAKDKGKYDMSMDWVDVSWGFMFPWNSMRNYYWWGLGQMGHLPRYESGEKQNRLNLHLPGPDGKVIDIDQMLRDIPYMNSVEEQKEALSKLAWITNENAMGMVLFQNVTGAWANLKTVTGWPRVDEIEKYNRDMPVTTVPEDLQQVADLNQGFSGITPFVEGRYAPK
ncbi:ABC transporter substrate-binding protein [Lederbergia citrisecunda]|nr:ABC transporter substrate-binding protein [Lederbergia citrisecunda]